MISYAYEIICAGYDILDDFLFFLIPARFKYGPTPGRFKCDSLRIKRCHCSSPTSVCPFWHRNVWH